MLEFENHCPGLEDALFIIRDWNSKARSQETPGITGAFGLGVQNEAGQRQNRVWSRECTGHSKHPLPTKQEKTLHMDITRWSISKSDYVLCSQRQKSSIQSAKIRPGADPAQVMNSLLPNSDLN